MCKPQQHNVKVNTIEIFIIENGGTGTGGIVRDKNGDVMMAFSIPIQYNSSNMVEALAAEFGGKWCSQNAHINFDLEL